MIWPCSWQTTGRAMPAAWPGPWRSCSRSRKPGVASFLDTLGWVYYRRGEYQRAAEVLERAQASEESTPQRQFHLGMTYLKLGRIEEARPLLTAAANAAQPFVGIEVARKALGSL
ncbi:tetratricopeptide repeat protein [uncultured Thiohalocapsa sp.]|uniref:tetratricopeptide repeat protein n=1 Tax=uncultured Thiohalocapsa sp. TaxID=768990 RepID=UPI00345CBC78